MSSIKARFKKNRNFIFGFALPVLLTSPVTTLESGIDVGQGINVGPGKFAKKNKQRALNKRRASEF